MEESQAKINVIKFYHMANKTKFKLFQCDHLIYIYSKPSQFLLPSPLRPKYITSPNDHLTCVCIVCAYLTSLLYIWYKLKNGNKFLFYFSQLYKYYTFNLHLSWFQARQSFLIDLAEKLVVVKGLKSFNLSTIPHDLARQKI